MIFINGNNISLTRGDSAWLDVPIKDVVSGGMYTVKDDDELTLTVRVNVKRTADDTNCLFAKTIKGESTFHISPADTAELGYGEYHYDVELKTADGDRYTVVPDSKFVLTSEVT